MERKRDINVFIGIMALMAVIIGIWTIATLLTGLSSVNSQVSELGKQFCIATGTLNEYDIIVDYYTQIKGIEYLITAAFFVFFPVFYKNLSTKYAPIKNR